MDAWWGDLTLLQQILFFVAAPATLILVVQTILVLFGSADAGVDMEIDADASTDSFYTGADSGLSLFSIRGIMAFFAVGGFLGIAMISTGMHVAFALLIALGGGFFSLWLLAFLMHSMRKLQSSGNLNINNALDKTGIVYMPISEIQPGKVHVTFQERYTELSAISNEPLPTNTRIKVVKVIDSETVYVEKLLINQEEN